MTDPTPPPQKKKGPRHALPRGNRRGGSRPAKGVLAIGRSMMSLASAGILMVSGVAWVSQHDLLEGIITSNVLEGEPESTGGDQNILIMGLDSRLDQHGQPLPQDLYDALHAGDETSGGYNANVLIVLHVPGDGGQVVAISIPRDDYVDLVGCPSGVCEGKIKQAYGLAYQQALNDTSSDTSESEDDTAREQEAREAGRRSQISTVRRLLDIPIDHFVEVTLAAFFQIAQVVQPLTVCLNENTSDPYSGANFDKGEQQIDAAQAMAFVRQRRDVNDETFTDMDRTRRQQAFIASHVNAVRSSGALSSPSKLRDLVDVAKQNVAVDSGFDLPAFAKRAVKLAESPMTLYTLPIEQFQTTAYGEDINIIDVPTIRAIVANLLSGGSPDGTTSATTSTNPEPVPTLDVVNASWYEGLATAVLGKFTDSHLVAGTTTTAETTETTSRLEYGEGARDAADAMADQLNLIAMPSDTIAANHVRLTIGSDFPANDYLYESTTTTTTTTSTTAPSTVPTAAATATGTRAPVPTELSRMTTGGGIPCVK